MTDLFEQSDHRLKGAIEEVAQNIAGSILSKKSLFAIMEQLHGCTSANGSWTQRDAYDLLEAGLALHLSARSTPLLEDVPALSELVDSLTISSSDIRRCLRSTLSSSVAFAFASRATRSSICRATLPVL